MERAQSRIVERLLERGWNVTVLARVCDLPPQPGLRWTRVRTPRAPFVIAFPTFAICAAVLLATGARDRVVTTLGAIVPSRIDAATVQFCHHGFDGAGAAPNRGGTTPVDRVHQWLARQMARAMESWCYRPSRVRQLIAVSPGIREELQLAFPALAASVTVIANGVDAAHFRPDDATRTSVRSSLGISPASRAAIFVGGDWERKGLDVALRALATTPDWILLVVGPGDRRRYEVIAASVGVADRVMFAGPQADTWPFFAAADAFVLPTRYEGFALVTLEAAAAGLPLLLTAAAGAGALLVPGVNGCLLERTPEAFAGALALLSDTEVAKRMGEEARAAVGKFGWSEIGDAHAGLYLALRRDNDRPADTGTTAAT